MDNGVIIETIDCPDNMPIPNVGDTIDVTDEDGNIHSGIVESREFDIDKSREYYGVSIKVKK